MLPKLLPTLHPYMSSIHFAFSCSTSLNVFIPQLKHSPTSSSSSASISPLCLRPLPQCLRSPPLAGLLFFHCFLIFHTSRVSSLFFPLLTRSFFVSPFRCSSRDVMANAYNHFHEGRPSQPKPSHPLPTFLILPFHPSHLSTTLVPGLHESTQHTQWVSEHSGSPCPRQQQCPANPLLCPSPRQYWFFFYFFRSHGVSLTDNMLFFLAICACTRFTDNAYLPTSSEINFHTTCQERYSCSSLKPCTHSKRSTEDSTRVLQRASRNYRHWLESHETQSGNADPEGSYRKSIFSERVRKHSNTASVNAK